MKYFKSRIVQLYLWIRYSRVCLCMYVWFCGRICLRFYGGIHLILISKHHFFLVGWILLKPRSKSLYSYSMAFWKCTWISLSFPIIIVRRIRPSVGTFEQLTETVERRKTNALANQILVNVSERKAFWVGSKKRCDVGWNVWKMKARGGCKYL